MLLGRATRLSAYLTGHSKRYEFDLVLGTETDTGDSEGAAIGGCEPSGVDAASIEAVLAGFTGSFEQRVPVFSAVQMKGRRAYRMARAGERPEMPVRTVEAGGWELLVDALPRSVRLAVTVSPGTYVRALASGIGGVLGCGAHAASIRRVSVGTLRIEECSSDPSDPSGLITPLAAMRGYARIRLDPAQSAAVRHGNPVAGSATGTVLLVDDESDELLAVGAGDGAAIRPATVLEAL